MSAQAPARLPSPCGSGGSGGSGGSSGHGAADCGCGGCGRGGACGAGGCQEEGAVRPRFFAGQLLTEEDLQALTGYAVAKNRLHNRHFFGDGVVCGLAVTCHPCGGGQVVVHPGHALDCCGNDLVLTAARTLDVNALARDLRQQLSGVDCGDPCAELPAVPERRRYGLYVRYCETATDPVSAFVTDEPCGATGCEPTRVREGLRFELRSRKPTPPLPAGARARIDACVDPAVRTALQAVEELVEQAEEGLAIDGENLPFDLKKLADSTLAVAHAVNAVGTPADGARVRGVVARVGALTRHLEKHNLLSDTERKKPEIVDAVKAASAALERVAKEVLPQIARGESTPLEMSFARTVLERAFLAIVQADLPGTAHAPLWTEDSVKPLNGQLDDALCDLRERLLSRLDGAPDLAFCALRRTVHGLDIPCPPRQPPRAFAVRVALARQLLAAWEGFRQDCTELALLPPCPPCDDPAVLLAGLEVESC